MSEKIFCGNGRIVKIKYADKYIDVPKMSMSKEDINKIVRYMKDNNLEWVNLEMLEKKERVEKKPTHYVQIDTWKPETKPKVESIQEAKELSDDLPF